MVRFFTGSFFDKESYGLNAFETMLVGPVTAIEGSTNKNDVTLLDSHALFFQR